MRRLRRFQAGDVLPSRDAVLRRMEMPEEAAVSPVLEGLILSARQRFLEIVDPVGMAEPVSHDEFVRIYHGEGRNAPRTPLDEIAARAQRFALFVATVGSKISEEISRVFLSGDPAFGLVLDAFASEGANRLALALGETLLEHLRHQERVSADAAVLPYSPGYCGWHVSGQRALFAAIDAGAVGVTLGPNCLMTPMKSVSGVFVAGVPAVHRFRPAFAFCGDCSNRECIPRMASVKFA